MQDLSAQLARVAREIGATLGAAGHRAWIVGGAPRDLCLSRAPVDIDMASAARPEEVESIFPHTIPVGRAFGTIVIHGHGIDVQHTTFRSEMGYSDGRRPDGVSFGKSVEEDSTRRDFTCNALYLDPLTDDFLDPQHGLDDLAARRLACVGDPRGRFEEDGLRLLRMARFAAGLELEPGPGVLEAARAAGGKLRGVSPERILVELTRIFERPNASRALELLQNCGLLRLALPGVWGSGADEVSEAGAWERTRRVFASLPAPSGLELGLAALLDARRTSVHEGSGSADSESDLAALEIAVSLRVSRSVLNRLKEIWSLVRAIESGAMMPAPPRRSIRLRWMQSAEFEPALALARARATVSTPTADYIERVGRERELLDDGDVRPPAWITAHDLEAAGLPRGPLWGKALQEVETLQLDAKINSREEALAWISTFAARNTTTDHEGGNTPRNK